MHVKANTDSIAATAQVLSSAADAVAGEMDTLATASLAMGAGWKGDAQTAWTVRHAQIDTTVRDKAATLRIASQRALQYAQDLVKADVDGARSVLGL